MVVRELDPLDEMARLAEQALVIRPGDVLIIRIDPKLATQDAAAQMKRIAEERLPGVRVLVIGADQIAAYRPADPEEVTDGRTPAHRVP
jgi:hypothetical protein